MRKKLQDILKFEKDYRTLKKSDAPLLRRGHRCWFFDRDTDPFDFWRGALLLERRSFWQRATADRVIGPQESWADKAASEPAKRAISFQLLPGGGDFSSSGSIQ